MRELGKIVDLGEVADLGKVVNLGGGVIYPAESQSGANPVQRILDSMPSELRAALVWWMNPKAQGITNEYLLDGFLSDEGTSVLKDLSGNGHHGVIYGMTGEEGNGYINASGELCFDGQDDYVEIMSGVELTQYTIILHSPNTPLSTSYWIARSKDASANSSRIYAMGRQQNCVTSFGISFASSLTYSADGVNCLRAKKLTTSTGQAKFNDIEKSFTTNITDSSSSIDYIAKWIYNNTLSVVNLRSDMLFNRCLEDDELAWVRNNMII